MSNSFCYKNGQEILQRKEELRKVLEEKELREKVKKEEQKHRIFCQEMNKFWKRQHIEEQLIKEDAAFVCGTVHQCHRNRNGKLCDSTIFDTIPITSPIEKKLFNRPTIHKRKIEDADFFTGKFHRVSKEVVTSDILYQEFAISNKEEFDNFMQKNGFEWALGVKVTKMAHPEYPDFLSSISFGLIDIIFDRWTIEEYTYVLKITCKE